MAKRERHVGWSFEFGQGDLDRRKLLRDTRR